MSISRRKTPLIPPGTVSRILWHFTGGPKWLDEKKKQANKPKPPEQAYTNLKSILRSRELRLGSYKEIFRVVIRERRIRNLKTGKIVTEKNVPMTISSKPICCLSDIPAQHLGYHAQRYGKFAIGFHRSSVVRHEFNPVFYSLDHSGVAKSIYDGFWELQDANALQFSPFVSDIESATSEHQEMGDEIRGALEFIDSGLQELEEVVATARESLGQFLALTKTFAANEFDTVYCEREWRAVKPFVFSWEDLAMIVLPRGKGGSDYFADFTKRATSKLKLPRTIPIVPWEDLVEH